MISVNAECPEVALDQVDGLDELFTRCETKVFSRVLHIAEKAGRPAFLIAVPGSQAYELILIAAAKLRSSRVVISLSHTLTAEQQECELALAWGNLPRPRPDLVAEIMPDGEEAPWKVELNRHLVLPSPADRDAAHRIWTGYNQTAVAAKPLSEGQLYGVALRLLETQLLAGDETTLQALEHPAS